MNQFTPHNTRKGEKFVTATGITGTVSDCYFCPYRRTDMVLITYTLGARVGNPSKVVTHWTPTSEVKRLA